MRRSAFFRQVRGVSDYRRARKDVKSGLGDHVFALEGAPVFAAPASNDRERFPACKVDFASGGFVVDLSEGGSGGAGSIGRIWYRLQKNICN